MPVEYLKPSARDFFLCLVRSGIGTAATDTLAIPEDVNWKAMKALSKRQGLSAVVLNALNHTELTRPLPRELRFRWLGEVLQTYQERYRQYEKAISSLAAWYNRRGYKMMILKGYACSLDWPVPEHRPCGDIDIWLFGRQKEADKELSAWFKEHAPESKVDNSHHHHTVFEWEGFTVENHYDFVNVHEHKHSAEHEALFKELGRDDSHFVDVGGEKVYLPSPNLSAVFLIRHLAYHFAAIPINLRQVLDWAYFMKKHTHEIDSNWLIATLERFHLINFYNCVCGICVEDLGFDADLFPALRIDSDMKKRVLDEILAKRSKEKVPNTLIGRVIYRCRKWRSNEWKQQLCWYDETRIGAFLRGVWSHLLKPSSI